MVSCSSAKDGTVEWKVVEKVSENDFTEVREQEEMKYNKKYCTVLKYIAVEEKGNYNDMFQNLWPDNLDEDVSVINAAIMKDNIYAVSQDIKDQCELYQGRNM